MTDPLEGVPSSLQPDRRSPAKQPGAADPAKARFLVLQAVRFAGVVMAVVGALIVAGKLPVPAEVGYALVLAGGFDAIFVPMILSRAWKSQAGR